MEQNMDNGELVVDDLVRELAVSRSVFFKKLKMLTGLAPIEFIKEIRIKRATQLIETGEFNMIKPPICWFPDRLRILWHPVHPEYKHPDQRPVE